MDDLEPGRLSEPAVREAIDVLEKARRVGLERRRAEDRSCAWTTLCPAGDEQQRDARPTHDGAQRRVAAAAGLCGAAACAQHQHIGFARTRMEEDDTGDAALLDGQVYRGHAPP